MTSAIAIPADPDDPDDFDVTEAALERAYMGRRVRKLRNRLGMTQQEFAKVFGIPANSIRQYEIGRYMPPPAVRAYLKVIEMEPEMVKRVMGAQ
ncbi:helix-turn-helix domain-containing protein [Novosphingobium colocasiae]|uniref:helix-turn-helix domain-containing protein n=1 Tax=Novosphingobium colocasiae TaxID=1256513 RepID=UPI0035B1F5E4